MKADKIYNNFVESDFSLSFFQIRHAEIRYKNVFQSNSDSFRVLSNLTSGTDIDVFSI